MRFEMQSIHHILTACAVFALMLPIQSAHGSSDIYLNQQPSPVKIELTETGSQVSARFDINGLEQTEDGTVWRIPNEGIIGRDGHPDLPAIGRWIKVSDRGEVSLSYSTEERRSEGNAPQLFRSVTEEGRIDHVYTPRGVYPESPVTISEPMIMRGVRMVMLSLYPVRWDADREEYILTDQFDISLETTGEPGRNEVIDIPRQQSPDFARMVDALLVNPPRRDEPEQSLPRGYLVVANEEAPESIHEFIDWKRRVGHQVDLLTFDPDAVGHVELRDRIRDVYGDTGFEFLVFVGSLVGDADAGLEIPYEDTYYDIYFGQLEGDDMLPDVAVGTFNCLEAENLTCALRRSISYQYEPFMDNQEWFTRAGVAVGACSVPRDLSPSYSGKWVTEVLNRNGFDDISTSFFSDNGVDDPSRLIEQLYNRETNFIIVRGHEWELEVDNIEASEVYPFHFLVSSGTISPPETGAFNWAFRQGTPDNMKGPSAGFGHRSSPRTNVANALVGGMTQALFLLDIDSYGWARNYAVANLARVMPEDGVDLMPYYYSHWLYYGDPGQFVWLGVPREVEMSHPETVDPDATYMEVTVTDEDTPVFGATVCITQGDEFQLRSITDENGAAQFNWERGNLNDDDITVAVTGDGLYPASDQIGIEEERWHIALTSVEFDEEVLLSGMEFVLAVEVTNSGDEDSPGEIAYLLASSSPYLSVQDTVVINEPIEPNEVLELGFDGIISPDCPDDIVIPFSVWFGTLDGENSQHVGFSYTSAAAALSISDLGLNGDLEAGDEIEMRITLANNGHNSSWNMDALLQSESPFASVIEGESRFRIIEVDDESQQLGDPFVVRFDEETVTGSEADFRLVLFRGDDVVDTVEFVLNVGESDVTDPLGPDSYGYIALDNGDDDLVWAEAPEYNWLDINRFHGDVQGERLEVEFEVDNDEVDQTFLVELPFMFSYYGEEFEEISVCTNGWIAVGDQTNLKNQQNWTFPGINGAYGIIAVFWDRLHLSQADDGLYTFNDVDNSRFIIQWDAEVAGDGERGRNVFQIIIHDADEYPTPTGDNQILFQYNTVNNIDDDWEANAGCSVGISSPDGKEGLTYSFWNEYPRTAARLQNERAILWTTISYAEPAGSLFGQVIRQIDDALVEAATVTTSTGLRTVTDAEGNYRINNIAPGMINVRATADRYGLVLIEEIEVGEEQDIEQNFVLPHGWLTANPDSIYIELDREHQSVNVPFIIENTGSLVCGVSELFALFPDAIGFDYSVPNNNFELESDEQFVDSLWAGAIIDGCIIQGLYIGELIIVNSSPIDSVRIPFVVNVLETFEVVDDMPLAPEVFKLSPPFPNPFNSTSTVRFAVPAISDVTVSLFDLSGRLVRTIAAGEYGAGHYDAVIDGGDLTTGLYFLKMEAGDFRSVQRLVLVK